MFAHEEATSTWDATGTFFGVSVGTEKRERGAQGQRTGSGSFGDFRAFLLLNRDTLLLS